MRLFSRFNLSAYSAVLLSCAGGIALSSSSKLWATEVESLPPAPNLQQGTEQGSAPNSITPQATPPAIVSGIPEKIRTDVPPYTDRAIAMAPLKPLCEFLGAKPQYSDGIVTLSKTFLQNPPGLRTITVRTGGTVAQIQDGNGQRAVRLPLPVEVRLGAIFVPLRFTVEALGGEVERIPEGEVTIIREADRVGVLTPIAQEGYRGRDAATVTITNRVGRALSLRLAGPQRLAIELGRNSTITRKVRPGVYAYQAASTGMKTRSGVRRLIAGRKATWAWGRR